MAISPMMPLWTDAYLGDTHHLSTLEHGAYFLLLMTAWRSADGVLPDDDKMLAKYTRMTTDKWKKIRPILERFFTVKDGKWVQGRLMDERDADLRFRKSQSEKAKSRHMKNKDSGDAVACAGHMPPPSPSPSLDIKKDKTIVLSKKAPIRGTRLTKDWHLPTEWGMWAVGRGMTRQQVIEQQDCFRDYWISKTGANATKADWEATWRNWIRKHLEG